MILREVDIEKILNDTHKQLVKDVKWKQDSTFAKFSVPVFHSFESDGFKLSITGTINLYRFTYYSFCLLTNGVPIRRLDPQKNHKQIGENGNTILIKGLHKHTYSEIYRDTLAYVPTDISNPNNIQQTFLEFLRECNIIMNAKWNNPPNQERLPRI